MALAERYGALVSIADKVGPRAFTYLAWSGELVTVRILGVILARKGSERILGKNMIELGGKPLGSWTIEAAMHVRGLDEIVVSSDDVRILDVARACGATPLLRPDFLARGETPVPAAVDHVIEWCKAQRGVYPQNIVLLQPTSPLRTQADIEGSLHQFESSGKESLVSVCTIFQHPADGLLAESAGKWTLLKERVPLVDAASGRNAPCYWINGAIYITTLRRYARVHSFFDGDAAIYVMPQARSIDVDVPFDLELVRAVLYYARHVSPAILDL